jgi:hypothetical protein
MNDMPHNEVREEIDDVDLLVSVLKKSVGGRLGFIGAGKADSQLTII